MLQVSSYLNADFASSGLVNIVCGPEELVRGTEAEFLKELLPRVKRESLTLDLSRVERIDAAGIAALITLYCTAVESGRTFSVLEPSSHVRTLLKVVGLEPILVRGLEPGATLPPCREHAAA